MTQRFGALAIVLVAFLLAASVPADKPAEKPADKAALPKAVIDGSGPDWKELGADDFVNVNCDKDTWAWKGGVLYCTGKPVGVTRSKKQYTNFELVLEWNHRKKAGNSGVFVWTPED